MTYMHIVPPSVLIDMSSYWHEGILYLYIVFTLGNKSTFPLHQVYKYIASRISN